MIMKKINWKFIAFMLVLLFIAEGFLYLWLQTIDTIPELYDKKCRVDICGDYERYFFNMNDRLCWCFGDETSHYERIIGL